MVPRTLPKPYRIARKRGPNHYTVTGRPPRLSDFDAPAVRPDNAQRLVYEVVVQPTLGAERIMARVFRLSELGGYLVRWYRFYDGSAAGEAYFGASQAQLRAAMHYAVMAVRCLCANRLSVPDPVAVQHLTQYDALPVSLAPIASTWVDDIVLDDPLCSGTYPEGATLSGELPSITLEADLVRLPRRYLPVTHVPRMHKALSRMRAMQGRVFTSVVIETLPDGHALVYWYAHGGGGARRARSPMLQSQALRALRLAEHPWQGDTLTPVALPQYLPRTLSPFEPWRFAWPMGAWLTRPLREEDGPDGVLIWHPANRHLDNVERFAVSGDPLDLTEQVKLAVEQGLEETLPTWALERADKAYARQIKAYEQTLAAVPDLKELLK
jgi:hypothetical protein